MSVAGFAVPVQILQFAGSLVAILLLAWLAKAMRLGPARPLTNRSEIVAAAHEAQDGFLASRIACDSNGKAALAQDRDGRIMLLKSHGSHVAARMLDHRASAVADAALLKVDSGEKRFGVIALSLSEEEAHAWAEAIAGL